MSIESSIKQPAFFAKKKDNRLMEADSPKFGTFLGVFVPCILMLFGVIIFLRLGWIVGQAGLATTLIIITLAALIALITSLSMAAISTNIAVGQGGVYYMLSRSLGIEAGSAVGLPLFLKQSLTIAFCVIGFAESLHDLVPAWGITNISISTLGVLAVLAFTSVSGALKVQLGIFIAIIASLISFFTGGEVAPMHSETFTPTPLNSMGFWTVFAIFFPAMTGVESSVSLSGDLKNPSRSLPIGTISGILVAYLIYISISIFLVSHVSLERLAQDPLIMQDMASVPALIIVGIWGATLSSALGGLLGAPRTLQAIANDGIVPRIFGKTFGSTNEPRIATLVTCGIALVGICLGSVNVIAPLLTMICLICYAVLNLSAGIETLMANPSWRPRFRVHWSISLTGAVLCLIAMLMIDPGYAMLAMLLVALLYFFVNKRQFKASWADIRQGMLLYFSRLAIYQLAYSASSFKSWRPHFLVFTKSPEEHSTSLLKFSEAISQNRGFLTMAWFVPKGELVAKHQEVSQSMAHRFRKKNINALVQIKEANKITSGMNQMIEHYGLGPLTPNTIVFGGVKQERESTDFVRVLQTAYEKLFNIVIMNDDNRVLETKKGSEIHVWWDDLHPYNADLMLILAYMLQRNPAWKRSSICIKATVENELMKKNKIAYFKEISLTKRLTFDVEVLVSSHSNQDNLDLVKEISKDAGMVFFSLNPPPSKEGRVEEYAQYLQKVYQASKDHPSLALVLSSEHPHLGAVLN
jgi:amino acid transporter